MANFFRFRRFIFLLLSLTLSAQAMAVASMGACHRMKSLAMLQHVAMASEHDHPDSATHHMDAQIGDKAAHHGGAMHHTEPGGTAPSGDDSRVSCAACAACHLSSVILNTELELTDIPVSGATTFPDAEVARMSNVASGLERPPRA
jgi:hypothetical protein